MTEQDPSTEHGHEFDDVEPPTMAHDLNAFDEPEGQPDVWLPLRVPEWLGGIIVLALTVGVTVGVIMRASGSGLVGIVELGGLSMVLLTVLGAPALAARDEHVRLELADMVAGPRALKALKIIGGVIQIVVVAILIIAMWELFSTDLRRGTTIGGELRLERYWVSGTALVAFIFLLVAIAGRLFKDIRTAPEPKIHAGGS